MRRGRRGRPTNDGPVAPARSCSGYEPRAPARRRRYLTVSRPPIRATEQPRKHTRAHAHTHTHTRARAIARSLRNRYGPSFRANRRCNNSNNNILSRFVLSSRCCPSSHAATLTVTLVRPQCARTLDRARTRRSSRRPPLGSVYPRENCRHDVVTIVVATLTPRNYCVRGVCRYIIYIGTVRNPEFSNFNAAKCHTRIK